MGCTDEQGDDCYELDRPSRSVTLGEYWIAETEVTQQLWKAVMGNNPSAKGGCDDCPVESVNWDEANAFLTKLNQLMGKRYGLPTEVE